MPLALKARSDLRESRGIPVQWDLQVPLVLLASKVLPESPARQVPRVRKALQVSLVLPALKDFKVFKD